jgi:hypothetical protein
VKNLANEWVASLQILSGGIRLHPNGGVLGDAYGWSCWCIQIEDTIYLYGAMSAPSPSQWRAIRSLLKDMGIKHVVYERKNTKYDRTIRKDL